MAKRKRKTEHAWLMPRLDLLNAFLAELVRRPASKHSGVLPKRPKKRTSSRKKDGDFSYIAYKFAAYPTEEQRQVFFQTFGNCRKYWNLALADWQKTGKVNTPAHYKAMEEYDYLKLSDSLALANVQLNLEGAVSDSRVQEKGAPRFKKRGRCRTSYRTNNNTAGTGIRLEGKLLRLPKLKEPLRIKPHRKVREGGLLKSAAVTLEPSGRWTVSLVFQYEKEPRVYDPDVFSAIQGGSADGLSHIGLDMSLPYLYVDSEGRHPFYELDGGVVRFEKQYRSLEKRIGMEQRRLSRMVRGSHNYEKQKQKIAKLHAKAKQRRIDFLRQMACRLGRSYQIITIESLDIAGMKRALKFGKSLSDNGWSMFVELLSRAAERYGHLLLFADKWFPSSKKCCRCGYIHKELTLADRTYVCPKCGNVLDRDQQAAVNLDREGLRLLKEIHKDAPNTKVYGPRTRRAA